MRALALMMAAAVACGGCASPGVHFGGGRDLGTGHGDLAGHHDLAQGGGGDLANATDDLAMASTDDLAMAPVDDLAMAPADDLATPVVHDLAMPVSKGNTGDACANAANCRGTAPMCITRDAMGNVWPGGYCTSTCNPALNDPQTGINAACPGGNGICLGAANPGNCGTACTAMNGANPCKRAGYACFEVCEPQALSQCNPTVKGACGGGMTCVRIGADDVGQCTPSCNPFAQGCALIMNMPTGCFASDDTGEGLCSTIYRANGDGTACLYLNDCKAGLACYSPPNAMNQNQVVCRPYCGGPMNKACTNGHVCVDLSPNVTKAVVGVCGG
jgi:hypothetical protein